MSTINKDYSAILKRIKSAVKDIDGTIATIDRKTTEFELACLGILSTSEEIGAEKSDNRRKAKGVKT